MTLLEILLSIHCLLFISSWIIAGRWFMNQPSLKLKLARLLLVSCVLSPIIIQYLSPIQKSVTPKFVSFEALQDYVSQPILKVNKPDGLMKSETAFSLISMNYYQLFYILWGMIFLFRSQQFISGMVRLKTLLKDAVVHKTSGNLIVKISSACDIPLSVYFLNKAYILLPISLFSSTKNVHIAIAHEGQHLRNGDCLWAYFVEGLHILFFGNPGIQRWRKVLSELQEFSCDEVLVGHPKISAHDYGHCLFQVVQTVSKNALSSNRGFACTVGMALSKENEDSTFIIRRISMLSKYSSNASKPLLLGMAFAGFSIVAPLCLAYSTAGSLNSHITEVDVSHIDPKLQKNAELEIKNAVKRYHAKSGVIAIADPTNGTIIAFAETNKGTPSWKSRVFPPASLVKPFIAAAAIDSGHSSEAKIYDCHSPYSIKGRTFTNYNPDDVSASLIDAMTQSINVCFIKVSQETGAPVIRKKLTEFGFDTKSWWQSTNKDLELAKASLGENIPVTMDSLTKSYVLLANQGRLNSNKSIISAATSKSITHMLENVVANGTGKLAAIPNVAIAGKTATVKENRKDGKGEKLALFAGFAPADHPKYVMVVVIEGGHLNKNTGGELAAPVFHNVVQNALNHSPS